MKLAELAPLHEGFYEVSVVGSDTASDLWGACEDAMQALDLDLLDTPTLRRAAEAKAVLPLLQAERDNDHGEYNTPGLLNVAMVLVEHLQTQLKVYPPLKKFGQAVAQELKAKASARIGQETTYTKSVHKVADKLLALTK